jgi:hypothetical protein
LYIYFFYFCVGTQKWVTTIVRMDIYNIIFGHSSTYFPWIWYVSYYFHSSFLDGFCGKHDFLFVSFQSVIVDLYQEGSKINEFVWFNSQVKRIRQVKIFKLFNDSL